jgi:polar amino acid transport system substrate-binding protein
MLQAVFEHGGMAVRYEIVPWNRALVNAREGKAGAMIGVSQHEADIHGLLIGREPIGNSNDCLYVHAGSRIRFNHVEDLNALGSVAIVAGYAYDDGFGEWLARPENKRKIITEKGENSGEVSAKNLAIGRVDGVIEDGAVMAMIIRKLGLEAKIAAAGCDKAVPVYVAFSPKLANVQEIIKQFDDGVIELRQSKQLEKILGRYGQVDWK